MERRNFLKGVLGVIAGTQIPWIAQCPVPKKLQHKLKKYKAICILSTGQEIYAPQIKNTQVQTTNQVTWVFEDICVKQSIIISGLYIVDDLSLTIIAKKVFLPPVTVSPGNILHLSNFTLSLN